jgi:hypothetical protein
MGALVDTSGGVAVGLHGCSGFIGVVGVVVGLLLEEFDQVGNLVGDGVGTARVSGWCFGEFAYGIGTCTFYKVGLDACGVMGVVVGVLVSDSLDGRTKFKSVVFAGRELDVGQQDDGKFGVIDGDAVGMDAGNIGREKLHV